MPDPPPKSKALLAKVEGAVTKPPAVLTLLPIAVTTPVPVVVVAGAAPAPPPNTMALDANAAELAKADEPEKYKTPPEVPLVNPKPPLPIGNVPDTWVVKPILPQLGAAATPPEISALPVATSASLAKVLVVLAYNKSPIA